MSRKNTWKIIKEAVIAFDQDDVLTASAALAFYSALALAPLLLLFVSISSLIGYNFQDLLIREFDKLTGAQGGKAIAMIISSANTNQDMSPLSTVISFSILAFSASAVFGQLQVVLNKIFQARPLTWAGILIWLWRRTFSIGMVFTIGFLMLLSLIATAALSALFSGEHYVWTILQLSISICIFALMFAAIFRYVPDVKIPAADLWKGSILTSILFSAGHTAIGFYLGNSAIGSAYGAAGSLIVFLVWIYYSALIVFFGAETTQAITKNSLKT